MVKTEIIGYYFLTLLCTSSYEALGQSWTVNGYWTLLSGGLSPNIDSSFSGNLTMESPSINPNSRKSHSLIYNPILNSSYVYGGVLGSRKLFAIILISHLLEPLGGLWKYNDATGMWSLLTYPSSVSHGVMSVASSSNNPGYRVSHSMQFNAEGDAAFLFGGIINSNGNFGLFLIQPHSFMIFKGSDLWMYFPNTTQWTWIGGSNTPDNQALPGSLFIESTVNIPGARRSHTFCTTKDNLYVMGGYGRGSTAVSGKLFSTKR